MLSVLGIACRLYAHEGMWIPAVLDVVYDDMKGLGLKLTKDDLFSINHSSLKDAIVLFGGGCTAEVVSDQGLIFTNHHCGFDFIQFHSSLEHDYLTHGFWAMSREEELICEGLKATFIVSMEDVTERMFGGIAEGMSGEEASRIRESNKRQIEAEASKKSGGEGVVRAFDYGNQFFLIVTRTYSDVRLVGAPPGAIGKFGGDTDNWVWPRHTGDFSVFRIYANENNEPAAVAAANRPYTPGFSLEISLDGAHEGDYAMVYGFPGRTEHYLSSYAVDYIVQKSNPMRISMRETSLGIIDRRMKEDDKVRIQYAAKQSDISNAYKKWIGQSMGLSRFDAAGKKRVAESDFEQKISSLKENNYGDILPSLETIYKNSESVNIAREGFIEYVFYGPEIFSFAHQLVDLIVNYEMISSSGKLKDKISEIKKNARLFYKDFDLSTEKELFVSMTPLYRQYVDHSMGPDVFNRYLYKGKTDLWENTAELIYAKSFFSDSSYYFQMLDRLQPKSFAKIEKDPVYNISKNLFDVYYIKIKPEASAFNFQLEALMSRYVKAIREMDTSVNYWSDANSTLRISFGKVEGSAPRDGMDYTYYTTSDGILQKSEEDVYDYKIPDDLRSLFERRVFGAYGENGQLRVAFTSSNHTTGGNSGSPALNGKGQLIGINFDRTWESTMSDVFYHPDICRNIMVDVRYVLWVIDVYAHAGYLLDEMKLVRYSSEKAESK